MLILIHLYRRYVGKADNCLIDKDIDKDIYLQMTSGSRKTAYCDDLDLDVCYIKGIFKELRNLYLEKELMDVTLSAGSIEVPCHKAVLAAATPYFTRLCSPQR